MTLEFAIACATAAAAATAYVHARFATRAETRRLGERWNDFERRCAAELSGPPAGWS